MKAVAPPPHGIPTRTFGEFLRQWKSKQPTLPGIVPAQRPAAPLNRSPFDGHLRFGDCIECNARAGVFRTCSCGSSKFTVEAGTGPHVARLRCDGCGAGGRWLSRSYLEMAP
jgi:hypothetical protein